MTLKLYGLPISTYVRRVQVVLEEKQVPYELIAVDTANKEHKSPEYLDKHPFGVIPYLDDDGFIVYETRAICHYIATKFASQGTPELVPTVTDLRASAHFQQAASVELSYFSPYADKAVFENIFKPFQGKAPDTELFDSYVKSLDANLDGYERVLSKQKYLAGDNITIADLFHLPSGSLLARAQVNLLSVETRPNLARWWKDISSRPSWQKLAYSDEAFSPKPKAQ